MSSEDVATALRLKDEGNTLLGLHKYALAVEKYTRALALSPSPVFFSNRAQAYIKLESYGGNISDIFLCITNHHIVLRSCDSRCE